MNNSMNENVKMKFVVDGKYITRSYSLSEILTLGLSYADILKDAGADEGEC